MMTRDEFEKAVRAMKSEGVPLTMPNLLLRTELPRAVIETWLAEMDRPADAPPPSPPADGPSYGPPRRRVPARPAHRRGRGPRRARPASPARRPAAQGPRRQGRRQGHRARRVQAPRPRRRRAPRDRTTRRQHPHERPPHRRGFGALLRPVWPLLRGAAPHGGPRRGRVRARHRGVAVCAPARLGLPRVPACPWRTSRPAWPRRPTRGATTAAANGRPSSPPRSGATAQAVDAGPCADHNLWS
jgi:hypothetical protein